MIFYFELGILVQKVLEARCDHNCRITSRPPKQALEVFQWLTEPITVCADAYSIAAFQPLQYCSVFKSSPLVDAVSYYYCIDQRSGTDFYIAP